MEKTEVQYTRARFEEEKKTFEAHLDTISEASLNSLLDLSHYSDVKLLKCSPSRYTYGIDLLNALICYKSIISLHFACVQCAKGSMCLLTTSLDLGVDINMCNERGVTAFECFAQYERRNNKINEMVRYFFKHVNKLNGAGLHVHRQNRRQYDAICSRQDMRHFVNQQLAICYDDELKLMEDWKLKDGITLRDVLREETDLTPVLNKLKKMIKDESFEQKFSRLWRLVKLRYKQAITRQEWQPLIADAFYILVLQKLPQNCLDSITKHLMNYDLANFLMVAFNTCLINYRNDRRARMSTSNRLSIHRSPRKLPRI